MLQENLQQETQDNVQRIKSLLRQPDYHKLRDQLCQHAAHAQFKALAIDPSDAYHGKESEYKEAITDFKFFVRMVEVLDQMAGNDQKWEWIRLQPRVATEIIKVN